MKGGGGSGGESEARGEGSRQAPSSVINPAHVLQEPLHIGNLGLVFLAQRHAFAFLHVIYLYFALAEWIKG